MPLPRTARDVLPTMRGAVFASRVSVGALEHPPRDVLPMPPLWASALPGGGFPRGAVVELTSPANLGRGLGVALAACAASQRESVRQGGAMAWCAVLDPEATLFAPAVRASGVCLERLVVIRPPRSQLARVAVRVALSRIFSVIVVDVGSVPGAQQATGEKARLPCMNAWTKSARRLALAVETTPSTLFLLTEMLHHQSTSLPVAMRVELERQQPDMLVVRVAKEKFGRITPSRNVSWTRPSPELVRVVVNG